MIYLIKPDNLKDIYPEDMIMDYIELTYGFQYMHSRELYNKTCYLYGFTNKKEYYKTFKELHDDNLFIYIKKSMSKVEYCDLRQYDYAVADILDDENMFQINKKYK